MIKMAKNTGNNHRKGAVKDRTQVHNQKTDMYMKRDQLEDSSPENLLLIKVLQKKKIKRK